MIAWLSGKVVSVSGSYIILNCNGVGYQLLCSNSLLQEISIGSAKEILIYTDVKEDAINLYGFVDDLEKQVFLLLITVKGVGAKTASEILSKVDKSQLIKAISSQDLTKLNSIKGIGKKTAELIIVELRDKIKLLLSEVGESTGFVFDEAIETLMALGFNNRTASQALDRARSLNDLTNSDTATLVKVALKYV